MQTEGRQRGRARAMLPKTNFPNTLYGLVQCTVDMSPERCRACLDGLISAFPATFRCGQHGGRILVPRCTVRYETDDTFFNTANLSVDLHKPKRTSSTLFFALT
jgi:hypothetical protein